MEFFNHFNTVLFIIVENIIYSEWKFPTSSAATLEDER